MNNPVLHINKVRIQRQNHWVLCLLHFLWFLNMFFSSNFRHCKQYMTWRHNSLFSHCENDNTWNMEITACEDITLSQWIKQYFTVENVVIKLLNSLNWHLYVHLSIILNLDFQFNFKIINRMCFRGWKQTSHISNFISLFSLWVV